MQPAGAGVGKPQSARAADVCLLSLPFPHDLSLAKLDCENGHVFPLVREPSDNVLQR